MLHELWQRAEHLLDPFPSHRFLVEIHGLLVAGFSEVSGLSVQTDYEEYAEGGVNDYVHRFPARTRHEPIVLKRGVTMSSVLWDWYADVVSGKVVRRDGSIILFNNRLWEFRRWNFYEAFPVKWVGPALDASRSEVAVESIELVHNGLKLVW
mgnify:CR=1 FL=1